MNRQQENWELLTVLNMPWQDADKLSDDDRRFLLSRVTEVKDHALRQQQLESDLRAQESKLRDQHTQSLPEL